MAETKKKSELRTIECKECGKQAEEYCENENGIFYVCLSCGLTQGHRKCTGSYVGCGDNVHYLGEGVWGCSNFDSQYFICSIGD